MILLLGIEVGEKRLAQHFCQHSDALDDGLGRKREVVTREVDVSRRVERSRQGARSPSSAHAPPGCGSVPRYTMCSRK